MSGRANIIIDQGTSFSTTIQLNYANGSPIDLTSYTIESQIRKDYTSLNAVSFDTVASNTGQISLALSANASANMVYGRYVFDVLATDQFGNSTRVIEGQVNITPQVSR